MHTEYDTQTVTNTLALYGVKRRVWPSRVIVAVLALPVFSGAYMLGTIVKGLLGW